MNYILQTGKKIKFAEIKLSASKSIYNRVQIIQQLCSEKFIIKNSGDANDTRLLQLNIELFNSAIQSKKTNSELILDCMDAGTCFRFILSYIVFSLNKNITPTNFKVKLTGSERMQERPVAVLVNALTQLGANIKYVKNTDYPPLEITNSRLDHEEIQIDGNISSQFITSILLIAPCLEKGIKMHINKPLTSKPYVDMTLSLMSKFGIMYSVSPNFISVSHQKYNTQLLEKTDDIPLFYVEGDWSAASYWYSVLALSDISEIKLNGIYKNSIQGDSAIVRIMEHFCIETEFTNDGIIIRKNNSKLPDSFSYDYSDVPDLAQTLIVLCAALGIKGIHSGLHTLKIKETNRIKALKTELSKITPFIIEGENSLSIIETRPIEKNKEIQISTYKDHRMAMSFAALVFRFPKLVIENPEVVRKSYPNFWNDLKTLGVSISEE